MREGAIVLLPLAQSNARFSRGTGELRFAEAGGWCLKK